MVIMIPLHQEIHAYSLQPQEQINIHDRMSAEELKFKLEEMEASVTLRQNWQVDGRKSSYYLTLRDRERNAGKIIVQIDKGCISVSAPFHLYNDTKFHLVFENVKNHEKYESLPERPMLLASTLNNQNCIMKDLTVAVSGQAEKLHIFSSSQQFTCFELDVAEKSTTKFIALRETKEDFVQIKIQSFWMLQNNTDKEYLFRENSGTNQDIWIKSGPKQTVPFYSSLEEPILVLRDSLEACETEPFKITEGIKVRTLRLTSKVCSLYIKFYSLLQY